MINEFTDKVEIIAGGAKLAMTIDGYNYHVAKHGKQTNSILSNIVGKMASARPSLKNWSEPEFPSIEELTSQAHDNLVYKAILSSMDLVSPELGSSYAGNEFLKDSGKYTSIGSIVVEHDHRDQLDRLSHEDKELLKNSILTKTQFTQEQINAEIENIKNDIRRQDQSQKEYYEQRYEGALEGEISFELIK